jgi:hypothetical protein
MPWTVDDPPKCALNWEKEARRKCVEAANAVLRDGGTEQDAIFSCIHNAGKTEHPGGKDNEQKAEGGIELHPVTAQDMEMYSNVLLGSGIESGELVGFSDAIFCRAGRNANNDAVTEEGIEQLADTLKWMPIMNGHDTNQVVGFVLESKTRNKSTELIASGVLFQGRYPDVVQDVRDGKKKISMEAKAKEARCGECGQTFSAPRDYCSHLKDKSGTRWLDGLKSTGAAVVEHPAWETSFDANTFTMIASEIEYQPKEKQVVAVSVKEPTWIQEFRAWAENKLFPILGKTGIDQCYCEKCDKTFPHERGVPCSETKCPECGAMMKPVTGEEELMENVEGVDNDKKKWSKDVELKEGSLEKLGWPSCDKLVRALNDGKVAYKTLIQKLVYLQNITKDKATKSKAASCISRLQKAHESKTEGGILMAEFEILEGETLEEFSARLGLVAASELDAKEEELKAAFEAEKAELQANFEAREQELKAGAEKVKVGFERALELELGAEEATILAGLDEDAYALFKRQREEVVTVQASEEVVEEEDKEEEVAVEAGKLQGSVLPTTEKVDEALTVQGMGKFLTKKLAGGE